MLAVLADDDIFVFVVVATVAVGAGLAEGLLFRVLVERVHSTERVVLPQVKVSPGCALAVLIGLPLSVVPLVLPRSSRRH